MGNKVTDKVYEATKKARYEIEGFDSSWKIEVYADGSVSYIISNSTHMEEKPVQIVEGWSICDYPGLYPDQDGVEKNGFVWDGENGEWIDEETAIEEAVGEYMWDL